jgi:glycosyltransferase involved in cell wall biosynthesis
MGLPVVGSTCATQGVGAESGRDLVVADDPASQAASIRALLRDPGAALALGRRARRFVEENYEWDTCLRVLDEIVARVTTHA